MACVCPPKEESDKKAKILCKLKKLLKDIEDEAAVPVNPICVPCCVPICNFSEFNQSAATREPPKQEVIETPNVMVSSSNSFYTYIKDKKSYTFSSFFSFPI